jgi:hypothetical protein
LALKDRRVPQVRKVILGPLALSAQWARKVRQAPKEFQVQQGRKAPKVQ